MHCRVEHKSGKFKGYVSLVHATNTSTGRDALWECLLHIQSQMNDPWVVLGDFNVVLNDEEKMVEQGPVIGIANELQGFLDRVELGDLKFYGLKYTWSNHHTW